MLCDGESIWSSIIWCNAECTVRQMEFFLSGDILCLAYLERLKMKRIASLRSFRVFYLVEME